MKGYPRWRRRHLERAKAPATWSNGWLVVVAVGDGERRERWAGAGVARALCRGKPVRPLSRIRRRRALGPATPPADQGLAFHRQTTSGPWGGGARQALCRIGRELACLSTVCPHDAGVPGRVCAVKLLPASRSPPETGPCVRATPTRPPPSWPQPVPRLPGGRGSARGAMIRRREVGGRPRLARVPAEEKKKESTRRLPTGSGVVARGRCAVTVAWHRMSSYALPSIPWAARPSDLRTHGGPVWAGPVHGETPGHGWS